MSVRSWDKKIIRRRIYILPHPILMVDKVHVIGVGSTIGERRTVGRLSGCNARGRLAACTWAPKRSAQKSWDKFEIRDILKGGDYGMHECVHLHYWRIHRDIYMLKLMACTQYWNLGLNSKGIRVVVVDFYCGSNDETIPTSRVSNPAIAISWNDRWIWRSNTPCEFGGSQENTYIPFSALAEVSHISGACE